MGELRCVDGSILSVVAVACLDRAGTPYEITLEMARDQEPFGAVGERCGYQLAQLAARIRAAREDPEQARQWPDPDDRFPDAPAGYAPAGYAPAGRAPGEGDYLSLRSRDRGDLPGSGELRCSLRESARWLRECTGTGPREPGLLRRGTAAAGGWRLTRRAVVEAWGTSGAGVRAVLTSAELVTFFDTVLKEPDGAVLAGLASGGATTAGKQPGGISGPSRRQRGRVPDGTTPTRLPAVRVPAGGVALAAGGPPACGSDVRR